MDIDKRRYADALKRAVDKTLGIEMNEPVAWMSPDGKVSNTEGKLFYIPLYTHPVKELTDEEIDKAIEYANMQGYGSSYLEGLSDGFEMAKAILRKAQEK